MPTLAHIQRLVATELAAALSDATWTTAIPEISATFRRVPDYQLEDLGTLKVSVVPGPIGVNQNDQGQPRGADFFDIGVGIVIAKHVGSEQEIADLEDLNMAIVTPSAPTTSRWPKSRMRIGPIFRYQPHTTAKPLLSGTCSSRRSR